MRPWLVLLLVAPQVHGMYIGAQPAGVDRAALRAFAAQAEQELRGNILPFWLKHAPDDSTGGFHGLIDQGMQVRADAPRGALLTSRILWTFSAAYQRYRDPEYLAMARRAYRDLVDHFHDRENGGYYWTITADGRPLDPRKQIYGQVFALYGLSEYFRATGDAAAREEAVALYRLIDAKAHDDKNGGYFEAFTRDWVRHDPHQANVLGGRAPKSQNTHIHVLEAFTNLLRAWPDPGLRARQRELTGLMLDRIVDPRTHHLVLWMQDDWTPASEDYSYGHDIELSWLLVEAAGVLGDATLLERAQAAAVAIARVTAREGLDADGGLFTEGNARGVTIDRKDWWAQAEAAVGFVNAYQLTGEPEFLAAARKTWEFIETRCVDRKNGDWYEALRRDGTPLARTKVSLWKCPYHNSRACLQLAERLEALAGTVALSK